MDDVWVGSPSSKMCSDPPLSFPQRRGKGAGSDRSDLQIDGDWLRVLSTALKHLGERSSWLSQCRCPEVCSCPSPSSPTPLPFSPPLSFFPLSSSCPRLSKLASPIVGLKGSKWAVWHFPRMLHFVPSITDVRRYLTSPSCHSHSTGQASEAMRITGLPGI